jgi:L-iditol 2-dehydrogenase
MWSYRLTAPRTFELVERPAHGADVLADGQVLLRTVAVGVCGSDLPPYLGRYSGFPGDRGRLAAQLPGYPAHEIVAETVASRSADLRPGQLVVGWATKVDALSEFVVNDAADVAPYPSMEPELAVALQPLACVLSAVDRLPDVTGRIVAVIGQGPIGVLFNHVLRSRGARQVIGVDPIERVCPPDLRADVTIQTTSDRWVATLAPADRPFVVVEAVGHQTRTVASAVAAVADEGYVYAFGVNDEDVYPVSFMHLFRRNLTLMSGITVGHRPALAAAVEHARAHPELLTRYVTTVLPMSEVGKAFEMSLSPAPGQFKVVLSADPGGLRPPAVPD